MNLDSSTFCLAPWLVLSTTTNGFVKPCCNASLDGRYQNTRGEFFNLSKDSLETIWNSEDARQLRLDFITGKRQKRCQQCYDYEAIGKSSKRMSYLKFHDIESYLKDIEFSAANDGKAKDLPHEYELRPGNLCNLRCGSCDSRKSLPLFQERKRLTSKGEFSSTKMESFINDDVKEAQREGDLAWFEKTNLWSSLESTPVQQLSFYGGEPLVNPRVKSILKKIVEQGRSESIKLKISTNGSVMSPEWIEIISSFKQVVMHFSIDAYGKANDYLRHPSKWTSIERNVSDFVFDPSIQRRANKARRTVEVFIIPTIQALNILEIGNLYRWSLRILERLLRECSSLKFHVHWNALNYPHFLSLDALPDSARNLAIQRLSNLYSQTNYSDLPSLINFVKSAKFNPALHAELSDYCELIDKTRGVSVSGLEAGTFLAREL